MVVPKHAPGAKLGLPSSALIYRCDCAPQRSKTKLQEAHVIIVDSDSRSVARACPDDGLPRATLARPVAACDRQVAVLRFDWAGCRRSRATASRAWSNRIERRLQGVTQTPAINDIVMTTYSV